VTYRLRYLPDPRYPDAPALYFRRTGRDRRRGWLLWHVVTGDTFQQPTTWRTLEGVTGFIEANRWVTEHFEIVEVTA